MRPDHGVQRRAGESVGTHLVVQIERLRGSPGVGQPRDEPRLRPRPHPAAGRLREQLRQAPVAVRSREHERVQRPAGERGSRRRRIGGEDRHEVPQHLELRVPRRLGVHRLHVVDPPGHRVAEGDHQRRGRGRPGDVRAGRAERIGERRAPAEILDREGEHQLRHHERRGGTRGHAAQGAEPAFGDPEIEPIDHAEDRARGGRERLLWRLCRQQLLDRLLVAPLAGQQAAVREPHRAHVVGAALLQPLQQVLAEARVAAERPATVVPGDGQAQGAELREALRRIGQAKGDRPRRRDLVEHGRGDEELAVGLGQLADDVGREVAVQWIRRAARAGDVLTVVPRLEQDAGHPPAGRPHGGLGIDLGVPERRQCRGRLGRGERQLGIADPRHVVPEHRGRDLAAADEHDAHLPRRVPEHAFDHRRRVGGVAEALELVDHQDHRLAAGRLHQQARRLGMRDVGGERPRADPGDLRQRAGEGGVQIRDKPAGRCVRPVEREPGEVALQAPHGRGHGRRLAGTRRRRHHDHAVALDEIGEQPLHAWAYGVAFRRRRRADLAANDPGLWRPRLSRRLVRHRLPSCRRGAGRAHVPSLPRAVQPVQKSWTTCASPGLRGLKTSSSSPSGPASKARVTGGEMRTASSGPTSAT
jgi:hypothetical protein